MFLNREWNRAWLSGWGLLLIWVVSIAIPAPAAHGAGNDPAAAIQTEFRRVNQDLLEQRFAERTSQTMDALIRVATRALRDRGFEQDASILEIEWQGWAKRTVSILELGDHVPLSQWLSKAYLNLEEKLGPSLLRSLRLDDLNTLNFAIPVVFSPASWEKGEYRLHFVPYSAIISYWSAWLTCSWVSSGLWGWSCGKVADVPRVVMTRWLGPKLSDQIHAAAHSKNDDWGQR